ncbi:MAG: lytic murein transglycosylase [Bacteroidetes bacterium]|nr:lytic murein transglycosylase [Bacteroidota bacterium]MDA1119689.1 lytic murein transglycosylase [Bacteroidota bacterium]
MIRYFILTLLSVTGFECLSQINQQLVDDFARNFSYQNKIHVDEVRNILDSAEYQQSIIDKMDRPAEDMEWHRYRKIFITEERINAGVEFWDSNLAVINDVSQRYQVDPEIIVSIIGVESFFGTRKGTYKTLDALYTLAFGYPRRSKFFKAELATFLLLARKENLDVMSVKGSYAGAIGYVQFMPSSYEAYARSYEPDGDRDLVNSAEDALASVANYFREHRWQMGKPVTQLAILDTDARPLPSQSTKPKKTTNYYEGMGYKPSKPIDSNKLISLTAFSGYNQRSPTFSK